MIYTKFEQNTQRRYWHHR